ncbi:MAG: hypothetical protein ACRECH_11195 [Nitrososphaerales archaeon]
MNFVRHNLAVSTVAWVVLAVVIVAVGGFAAYFGSYAAVKSSQNYTTTSNELHLTIEALSFNETGSGSGTYEYNAIIKNSGTSTISGNLQLGFVSSTGQILANANCTLTLPLESGQSIQCSGDVSLSVSNGQSLTLEVITQSGSTMTYSFKVSIPAYSSTSLASAALYGGAENSAIGQPMSTSYFAFGINNQGGLNTTITELTLSGSGMSSVTNWETSGGVSYTSSGNNALAGSQTITFGFYPYGKAQSITTGQVFNYVINFANGQSMSGSLIAQ